MRVYVCVCGVGVRVCVMFVECVLELKRTFIAYPRFKMQTFVSAWCRDPTWHFCWKMDGFAGWVSQKSYPLHLEERKKGKLYPDPSVSAVGIYK